MSTVLDPSTACGELLARIHSVVLEEAVSIDEGEYDAIWLLRRQREELTRKVAEACALLAATGELEPTVEQQMRVSMARIAACDQANRLHLEQHRKQLADELAHLEEGRRAVDGYRVPGGTTAAYVDRRG